MKVHYFYNRVYCSIIECLYYALQEFIFCGKYTAIFNHRRLGCFQIPLIGFRFFSRLKKCFYINFSLILFFCYHYIYIQKHVSIIKIFLLVIHIVIYKKKKNHIIYMVKVWHTYIIQRLGSANKPVGVFFLVHRPFWDVNKITVPASMDRPSNNKKHIFLK